MRQSDQRRGAFRKKKPRRPSRTLTKRAERYITLNSFVKHPGCKQGEKAPESPVSNEKIRNRYSNIFTHHSIYKRLCAIYPKAVRRGRMIENWAHAKI